MSLDDITIRQNGNPIDETWFNRLKRAFSGIIAPRNTSTAVVENEAGSLGSASYRFKKLYVETNFLCAGMIKLKYNYSGLGLSPPAGWMLCDGRVINQANYDAEHGAGKWASEVESSIIDGQTLPNLDDVYIGNTFSTTGLHDFSHVHTVDMDTVNSEAGNILILLGGASSFVEHGGFHSTVNSSSDLTNVNFTPKGIKFNAYMRVF